MSENYQYMKKYTEKYLAKMDEIRIRMPKESGLKESIKAHAESKGESVQAFILRAIQETMRNDKRKGIVLNGEGAQWMEDYLKEE